MLLFLYVLKCEKQRGIIMACKLYRKEGKEIVMEMVPAEGVDHMLKTGWANCPEDLAPKKKAKKEEPKEES